MEKALEPQLAIQPERRWRSFCLAVMACAGVIGLALCLLILWADPFGLRVRPGGPAPILMDSNQRYVYPQLVRSGRFDSAVLGTSSSRLIDPAKLSEGFGARFANLAMNAATPWEQMRMAQLVRANWREPRVVIWGIDATWCEADATSDAKRLTPRPFPDEFYADQPPGLRAMAQQMNLATLEIAFRRLGLAIGQGATRMRADGFDEFTPPDSQYDLARARFHLYLAHGGKPPVVMPPVVMPPSVMPPSVMPPAVMPSTVDVAVRAEDDMFPGLAWLEQELAALPASTRKLIVLPPLHWASLPRPGFGDAAREAACKQALGAVAVRANATLVDYRLLSPLTRDDSRFWDPLHYRVDVARRIEAELITADRAGRLEGADVLLRHVQRR
jgi:hypothetical protein